jgi:CRP-like cAMP-binding protein
MLADSAGPPPPSGDDAARSIDGHIQALREMAANEAESRREAERYVEASRERERRLEKAIAALEGVPLGAGGRPKAKATAKSSTWRVGDQVVSEVEAALRALLASDGAEAATVPQVAEATGRSRETVRRALERLREQGTVRLAGKRHLSTHGMPSTLYALMPNAD